MPFASKAELSRGATGAAGRGRAQAAPVEPEALAPLEAQLRQQFRATDPEFLAQAAELKKAHDREAQAQFSNDLKTIRAAYPDEKAQKVEELGIEFLKLCAGGISPLVAYEAIRNEKARSAANPPSMGDVKTSPTNGKGVFHARGGGGYGPGDGKPVFRQDPKITAILEITKGETTKHGI